MAIARFRPEKSPNADDYDADIECVVQREDHEVIDQNQRNMNQSTHPKNQQVHQDADVRRAPLPKPVGPLVLVEIDRLYSIRSPRDSPLDWNPETFGKPRTLRFDRAYDVKAVAFKRGHRRGSDPDIGEEKLHQ